MKTRAAIALEKGKPLTVTEVELDGPESLRSAGRGKSHRHLPHRRIHAVRRRSGGPIPGHPGPRGRRHCRRRRAGRDQRQERRPRHPALYAGMPAMPVMSVAQDQSMHRHPCNAGPGCHARWHLALLARREEIAPLHGHVHFLEFHGAARDRRRQDFAKTPRSTRSATSAAASRPASAPSSTPPRWSPAPNASCLGSAASASMSSRDCGLPAPT